MYLEWFFVLCPGVVQHHFTVFAKELEVLESVLANVALNIVDLAM
jgi:hypothetical protein